MDKKMFRHFLSMQAMAADHPVSPDDLRHRKGGFAEQ
jgi:hypothetical protein